MKKIVSALLCIALLLTVFTACSKKEEVAPQKVTNVYRGVSSAIPDEIQEVYSINVKNDKLYCYGSNYGDNFDEQVLLYMNLDGTDAHRIPLSCLQRHNYDDPQGGPIMTYAATGMVGTAAATAAPEAVVESEEEIVEEDDVISEDETPVDDDMVIMPAPVPGGSEENVNLGSFSVAEDDTIWYIENHYSATYTEDGDYFGTEDYALVHADLSGNELFRMALNDFNENPDDWFYVGNLIVDKNGLIYFQLSDQAIVVIDDTGAEQFRIRFDDTEYVGLSQMMLSNTGSVICMVYDENYTEGNLAEIDIAAKAFGRTASLKDPENPFSSAQILPGCGSYSLFLQDNETISGYDIETGTKTVLMNFINSDVDTSMTHNFLPISDTEMYALSYDEEFTNELLHLTRIPDEEVVAKKIVVLGTAGIDYNTRRAVIDFNKTNEEYRIEIRDYSNGSGGYIGRAVYDGAMGMAGEEIDWEYAMKKFNTEIIAGNIPDIIQIDYNMPYNSYVSKGLLCDLYPFIEKDETLSREDFMPNILTALETDGKLFSITNGFDVQTLVGKSSVVGDRNTWTMDDLYALFENSPEGTRLFADMTRADFMDMAIMLGSDAFIDWEKGTCDFNTPAFAKLLELAATFPEEIDWESIYGEDYDWTEYEMQYRNNKTLLMQSYISDFRSLHNLQAMQFGENVSLIGFPVSSGNGSVLSLNAQYAISNASKCKDGAWAFLSTLLSDKFIQDNIYNIPVKTALVREKMTADMEPYTYEDENGEIVEMPNTYWINDEEIDIGYPTQDEVERLFNFITGVTTVYRTDTALKNIITEETGAFFAGQKSASDVAGIIQSKVTIYLSESR